MSLEFIMLHTHTHIYIYIVLEVTNIGSMSCHFGYHIYDSDIYGRPKLVT